VTARAAASQARSEADQQACDDDRDPALFAHRNDEIPAEDARRSPAGKDQRGSTEQTDEEDAAPDAVADRAGEQARHHTAHPSDLAVEREQQRGRGADAHTPEERGDGSEVNDAHRASMVPRETPSRTWPDGHHDVMRFPRPRRAATMGVPQVKHGRPSRP